MKAFFDIPNNDLPNEFIDYNLFLSYMPMFKEFNSIKKDMINEAQTLDIQASLTKL